MSELDVSNSSNKTFKIIVSAVAALLVVTAIGFTVYSAVCPCERTPGGFLFGQEAEGPVSDWTFANDVALCQLQIYDGIRPHSINLNCMSTPEGDLYLSCSACTGKYWASKVGLNEPGVMRLDGVVYPIVLNREIDPIKMDSAWNSRIAKLQTFGGAPVNPVPDPNANRPDHWWTFHVESSI